MTEKSKCDKCKRPCDDKNILRMIEQEKEITLEVIITECSKLI
jgi:hypothetical protein